MNAVQENLQLLWPATNVSEDGKLISPPYRIFSLSALDLAMGLVSQKGGFQYFVEEGYLCQDAAKRFIQKYGKHNLWDSVGIVDRLDQTSYYGNRKAIIHVKSHSGYDTQVYAITCDNTFNSR